MKFYQKKQRLFSALALSAGLLLFAGGAAFADSVKAETANGAAEIRVELENMPEAVQGYQISFSVKDSSGNSPANLEWSSGDRLQADVLRGNYTDGILQIVVADDERIYGGAGKATLDLGRITLPKNQSYTLELIPGSFKGASGSLSNLGIVLDKEDVKVQLGDSSTPSKPDSSSSTVSRPSSSNRPSGGGSGGSYSGGESSSSKDEVSSKPAPVSSEQELPSSKASSNTVLTSSSGNSGQGNTAVSQETSSKEEPSSEESSSESSSSMEEDQPTVGETPPSQPDEEATSFPLLWVIIGLAVIAVIVAVVIFLRSNNRKYR